MSPATRQLAARPWASAPGQACRFAFNEAMVASGICTRTGLVVTSVAKGMAWTYAGVAHAGTGVPVRLSFGSNRFRLPSRYEPPGSVSDKLTVEPACYPPMSVLPMHTIPIFGMD